MNLRRWREVTAPAIDRNRLWRRQARPGRRGGGVGPRVNRQLARRLEQGDDRGVDIPDPRRLWHRSFDVVTGRRHPDSGARYDSRSIVADGGEDGERIGVRRVPRSTTPAAGSVVGSSPSDVGASGGSPRRRDGRERRGLLEDPARCRRGVDRCGTGPRNDRLGGRHEWSECVTGRAPDTAPSDRRTAPRARAG